MVVCGKRHIFQIQHHLYIVCHSGDLIIENKKEIFISRCVCVNSAITLSLFLFHGAVRANGRIKAPCTQNDSNDELKHKSCKQKSMTLHKSWDYATHTQSYGISVDLKNAYIRTGCVSSVFLFIFEATLTRRKPTENIKNSCRCEMVKR